MIIIGGGRIGTALKNRSDAAGIDCELVTRESGWEALAGPVGDPILLAVRNDDLAQVLERVPPIRRKDLVFVQNGMFRAWLDDERLRGCTRGLLYFAVASVGGEVEPGLPSPFCGPHSFALTRWLSLLGLDAEEVDWARFSYRELEKLIWICAFGLLAEVYDEDVGTLSTTRVAELTSVVEEMRIVCRKALNVDVELGYLLQRLIAYSMTIPDYKSSVKAWKWRNGWFDMAGAHYGYHMVAHRELLRAIGKGDLLIEGPKPANLPTSAPE